MKKITILLPILTAFILFCLVPMCGQSWGGTLSGVTISGGAVSTVAPVNSWDLAYDLIDRTGNIHGTETHAGDKRTRVNPDTGWIEDVPAHAARFELAGGYRALLIEPAGENLIHYSHKLGEDASGSWWNDGRLTSVTANGMLAPDGTMSADGLVANTENNRHSVTSSKIVDVAPNDKISGTVYAKKGNVNFVRLAIRFFTDGDVDLGDTSGYYFNISTGEIGVKAELGNATVHAFLLEENANGFYRIGVIVSSSSATVAKVEISIYSAEVNGDPFFIGDEVTVNTWFWGADLKIDPVPTSYIATSGIAVTRATESGEPHFTLPTGLFDEKGTLIVHWRPGWDYAITPPDTYVIVGIDYEVNAILYTWSDEARIRSYDGTNLASISLNFVANTWYKLIVTWGYLVGGVEKFKVGVDTGLGVSWVSEHPFDGSYDLGTYIRLGFNLFSRMHLRGFRLFRDVLTDVEIDRE